MNEIILDPIIISVVLPTFNRQSILHGTIENLCDQSFNPNEYEIVVVDDCSTDGTLAYLSQLRLKVRFSYVRNANNLGRAKTRNIGIRKAIGQYVLMIDNDIWATRNLIAEHYALHKANPDGVAVVGAVLPTDEETQSALDLTLKAHHLWCHAEMTRQQNKLPATFCKTANLSLSKKVFDRVGLFQESFINYGGEDTDLGMRIVEAGVPLLYAPLAIGYHHDNETIDSIIHKEMQRAKSDYLFYSLHGEPDHTSDGFFAPYYHKITSMRMLWYDLIKMVIFLPLAANIIKLLVGLLNNTKWARTIVIIFLIPTLRMQFYRIGLKEIQHLRQY